MPRLGGEGDAGQILRGGKDIALSGDQSSAEGRIEIVFLSDFPGRHFPCCWPGRTRLAIQIADSLPGNGLLWRCRTHRQARHGRFALLNRGRLALRIEASHESVFDLVRVTEDVALVKVEQFRKIIHARPKTVDGSRLDDVLPLSS